MCLSYFLSSPLLKMEFESLSKVWSDLYRVSLGGLSASGKLGNPIKAVLFGPSTPKNVIRSKDLKAYFAIKKRPQTDLQHAKILLMGSNLL